MTYSQKHKKFFRVEKFFEEIRKQILLKSLLKTINLIAEKYYQILKIKSYKATQIVTVLLDF